MSKPLDFLKNTLPELFEKGMSVLKTKADAGDAKAKARHDDAAGARGAVYLVCEGEGEAWLAVQDGTMKGGDAKPDGLDVRMAVAFPADAAGVVLGELAKEDTSSDEAAVHATNLVSKQVEDVLAGKTLSFHVIATDVPDLGTVTTRIGINLPEPPAEPGFTATLKYDDLEAVREGELNVQQLFMGGKLRMAGDYSAALQIAMQLMQMAQKAR